MGSRFDTPQPHFEVPTRSTSCAALGLVDVRVKLSPSFESNWVRSFLFHWKAPDFFYGDGDEDEDGVFKKKKKNLKLPVDEMQESVVRHQQISWYSMYNDQQPAKAE